METVNSRTVGNTKTKSDSREAKSAAVPTARDAAAIEAELLQAKLDEIAADMDRYASFPCTD